jgi:hypothetical protein
MIHVVRPWIWVLEGPDTDLQNLWNEFKKEFEKDVGLRPNTFTYDDHLDYVIRRLTALRRYQMKYNCPFELHMIFLSYLKEQGWRHLGHREAVIL